MQLIPPTVDNVYGVDDLGAFLLQTALATRHPLVIVTVIGSNRTHLLLEIERVPQQLFPKPALVVAISGPDGVIGFMPQSISEGLFRRQPIMGRPPGYESGSSPTSAEDMLECRPF